MTNLSIVIVNYNTNELTQACIESIKKNCNVNYEIIIVNNGNEKFETSDLRIKSIVQQENKGFGSANNFGAKEAKGKYLLLLNSDTMVIDNSIDKMLAFLKKHEEISALTCLLYNDLKSTKLQKNFFGKFQSLASVTFRHYNYQKIDKQKEFFYADIITAAALMIKKDLFDKTGGFDERFFMYLEDDDLCRRLVNEGYKNAVLTTAKVIHFEGKSIKKNSLRKKIYYQSQNIYWKKHNGFFPTLLMRLIRWPYKLLKTLY